MKTSEKEGPALRLLSVATHPGQTGRRGPGSALPSLHSIQGGALDLWPGEGQRCADPGSPQHPGPCWEERRGLQGYASGPRGVWKAKTWHPLHREAWPRRLVAGSPPSTHPSSRPPEGLLMVVGSRTIASHITQTTTDTTLLILYALQISPISKSPLTLRLQILYTTRCVRSRQPMRVHSLHVRENKGTDAKAQRFTELLESPHPKPHTTTGQSQFPELGSSQRPGEPPEARRNGISPSCSQPGPGPRGPSTGSRPPLLTGCPGFCPRPAPWLSPTKPCSLAQKPSSYQAAGPESGDQPLWP